MNYDMDCQLNCSVGNISEDSPEDDDAKLDGFEDFLLNCRFVVQKILIPIFCILGIIVNSLTILVFSQRRLRSSTNIYLRALAVCDLLYLLSILTLSFYSYPYHPYFLYYKSYGILICDVASNTSVWLTAAFTIERFFVVANPMKNLKYASAQFAQRIVILIAVLCFAFTLSTVFEHRVVHVKSNHTNVTTTVLSWETTALGENEAYEWFMSIFSAVVFVLIPFITIATLNVFLINSLQQARNIRNSLSAAMVFSEKRTTLLLVVVVLMFLVCQGPIATIMIVNLFVRLNGNLYRGINNIFNLLVVINACGNFFLYVGLSAKFRTTFLGLLFSKFSTKLIPQSLRDRAGFPEGGGYGGSVYHPAGHCGGHHNRTYAL